MIRAVFLDIDDTLLSFSGYVRETMKNGFTLFGLPPYREEMFPVFEKVNGLLWKQLERGELSFEELIRIRWDRIFGELDIHFDGKTFEDYFRKQLFYSAVPEPGALELLDYLKSRYVLCAASNGPYDQQLNRLRVGKMDGYFSGIFISEKLGASKPKKEFFEACFRELRQNGLPDLLPGETVMIGDSLSSDIAGGKAFGMKTCLYDRSGRYQDAASADHRVSSLCGITRIL